VDRVPAADSGKQETPMHRTLVLALLLPGCSLLESEESDNTLSDPVDVTVNFKLLGHGGVPAECPPGFDQLMIFATRDIAFEGFYEYIPCASSGSYTYPLYRRGSIANDIGGRIDAQTMYQMQLFTTDDSHSLYRDTGTVKLADLTGGPITIDLEVFPDAQRSLIEWSFSSTQTSSSNPSCEAMDVDEVAIDYWPRGNEVEVFSLRLPCEHVEDLAEGGSLFDETAGHAVTEVLAYGDYDGVARAYRAGVEISMDDVFFPNVKDDIGDGIGGYGGVTFVIADR
jgi:hypothetical protein